MKRNILKLLSVALALAMILSMVPMMVMAEEVHEHDDVCICSEAAPAAVICTHTYRVSPSYDYLANGAAGHWTTVYNVYTCSQCEVSYSEKASEYSDNHTWATAENDYYVYCIYCGYIK